ncbi:MULTISPECIES: hypothetical protein [unclassified Paraflavitalea]|uniref:hypothetical protein n=1 Tax=unclassified Paraflavitalea TaxID=2798305 RepID=UPI003D337FBA
MAVLQFTYKGKRFKAWVERTPTPEIRFQYLILEAKIDKNVEVEIYSYNYSSELFLNGEKIDNPELLAALRSAK